MRDAQQTVVQVFYGKNDQWYFRTMARNYQIGDVSEGYTRKAACLRAAKRWHPGVPITILAKEEKV